MARLQEVEIFACMAENLRTAAEDCKQLAWHPRRGFVYIRFTRALKQVEGACRQAYYFRDYDSRWLDLALQMAEVQKRAGNWLREYTSKDGRKVANPMFVKAGEVLEAARAHAERLKDTATFHVGPILPTLAPAPHREARPIAVGGMRRSAGGVWLPA